MDSPERPESLLDQIEARQDDVIAQLDELNARAESLLREWTTERKTDPPAEAKQSTELWAGLPARPPTSVGRSGDRPTTQAKR